MQTGFAFNNVRLSNIIVFKLNNNTLRFNLPKTNKGDYKYI